MKLLPIQAYFHQTGKKIASSSVLFLRGYWLRIPGGVKGLVYSEHLATPLKINMEHNHGGLEDHFPL